MKETEKIAKSKDVSLDTKVKVIHTLIFPMTMYGCKSYTVKKAERRKQLTHLKCEVRGEGYGYPRPPERQTSGSSSK